MVAFSALFHYNPHGNGWFPLPMEKAEEYATDNNRMVFFHRACVCYSTVGLCGRCCAGFRSPFPGSGGRFDSSAPACRVQCRAFGQCVCLAVSMLLFFAPVLSALPRLRPPGLSRPAASSPLLNPHTNSPGRGFISWPKGPQTERRFNAEIRRGVHRGSRSPLPSNGGGCGDAGNADGGDLLAARNGGARPPAAPSSERAW